MRVENAERISCLSAMSVLVLGILGRGLGEMARM